MDQPDPTPPDEDVLSSQIIERLLRYDELEEAELAELEADPSVRTELHRLQLAEAWLTEPSPAEESSVEALADSSPCPSAEDLFDYGQKLEPTALEISHQVELAEHIETCAECAGLGRARECLGTVTDMLNPGDPSFCTFTCARLARISSVFLVIAVTTCRNASSSARKTRPFSTKSLTST